MGEWSAHEVRAVSAMVPASLAGTSVFFYFEDVLGVGFLKIFLSFMKVVGLIKRIKSLDRDNNSFKFA